MRRRQTNRNTCRKDYGQYHFSLPEVIGYAAAGSALGVLVQWICYRDLRAVPVAAVITVLFVRARQRILCRARRETLLAHFGEALRALHGSLNAGYSLENALDQAVGDMEKLYGEGDILAAELREIRRGVSLQIPIEQMFSDLGKRSHLEDLQRFGEVLLIAKRTGGNLDAAIRNCSRTICERIDLHREIETLTAAKRFEYRIMSLMPVGIILYARLSFGGFLDPLYGNAAGVVIMSLALAVYGAALWLGNKMVRIEV